MSRLKQLKHLDYAVYGNLIVPMLMFDAISIMDIFDDNEGGKCRIVSRRRKNKSYN
ncbi:hypothetical protein J40TS1_33860 [Paenibacillus montaniterrae]|uniref:Uncharacterized protein n=1 Tax=Paenibacillus montaniterrae TaxID=429341 RepID=A0A919YSV5_9BACL|nr:hypothetical protein J40TS1_33860 [Paenibacillus montaniterrae]